MAPVPTMLPKAGETTGIDHRYREPAGTVGCGFDVNKIMSDGKNSAGNPNRKDDILDAASDRAIETVRESIRAGTAKLNRPSRRIQAAKKAKPEPA